MNAHRIRRGIGRVFFGLSVFALISPAILVFLWMLSLSLKNEVDNMSFVPVFIPNPPTLNNFIEVFERNDFLTYTINSVIVSFGATGLALLLGVPAGFGAPSGSISSGWPLINCAAFSKSAWAFANWRTERWRCPR